MRPVQRDEALAYLREHGPSTVREMVEGIKGEYNRDLITILSQNLRSMEKNGRVRKYGCVKNSRGQLATL